MQEAAAELTSAWGGRRAAVATMTQEGCLPDTKEMGLGRHKIGRARQSHGTILTSAPGANTQPAFRTKRRRKTDDKAQSSQK